MSRCFLQILSTHYDIEVEEQYLFIRHLLQFQGTQHPFVSQEAAGQRPSAAACHRNILQYNFQKVHKVQSNNKVTNHVRYYPFKGG